MSAATMSGADTVKGVNASSSKQSLKSSTSGKALDTARKQAASPPTEGQNRKSQPLQQKAWTGTNPITQRQSPVVANGTDKSTSRPTSQSLGKAVVEVNGDKHAHDRALFLFASFTGNEATVTLKSGEQFTGIFSGGSFNNASKVQYILKMVKRTRRPTAYVMVNGNSPILGDDDYIGEGEDHMMVFDKEDAVDLNVPSLTPLTAQPLQNGSISTSFRTDTEISGRDPSMPRERELQRWDAGAETALGFSIEDSGSTGWDQFAVNEAMYGVSTTYDENIYTTQIDRSDPRYTQLEAKAARIAREIEGTAPVNSHVAEERQQNATRVDGGMDEEEKYSGVRRDAAPLPKRATGAYVPPSQRPITTIPTVPGAPFDPAIISSTIARPSPATARVVEQPTDVEVAPTEQLTTPPSEPAAQDPHSAGPATTQPTPAKRTENMTEDHVRGVLDQFKQFANNEKLRVRDQQAQKRQQQRAEKNVRMNDLKKFSANFKLTSRIPEDLVPILAKDHDKQQEIQRKADEAYKEKEKEARQKEADKASVGAASPAPSAASSIAGTAVGAAAAQTGRPELAHVPFNQQNRNARMSGNTRPPQPIPPIHMQSPSRNIGGAPNRAYANIPGFPPRPQPFPSDIKIPTGPSHPGMSTDLGPLSPGAATRLNAGAKAFEFRPGAHAFTPTGTTPSPHRLDPEPETAEFFAKDKSAGSEAKDEETNDSSNVFRGVTQVPEEPADEMKPQYITTGGLPQPYRTAPTWGSESQKDFVTFADHMPKAPTPSQTHSQVHTPNPNAGQIPHQHQLPPHMQQQAGTPNQRPPFMPPHHFPPNIPQHHPAQFGPGMHGFGGNGSVQSSPRFSNTQVAFNGQIPQGMGMPQFAGQQFNGQQVAQMGMQGYGMSPQMGYRQVQMPGMPPGGPNMMMMPGGQGQHGQMQMNPNYPRNPQQYNPNMMQGGVPMQNQASASGYPIPAPPNQSYSPMPPHATPHMQHPHPHNHHIQQSPYAGSPRPAHLMQHTVSHQGFNPGAGGPMGPYAGQGMAGQGMAGGYGQHPYAVQHRQMSAGNYAAMTPRQAPAMPMQPSPGMAGAGTGVHGDEGK